MSGRVSGVCGPTVRSDAAGLALHERVAVGRQGLTGEVVRLEAAGAVIQVYEETRGLALGEPVTGSGSSLEVVLGPGLLGRMLDGLERPLDRLLASQGPFLEAGGALPALDDRRCWPFTPGRRPGETVTAGDELGWVSEGRLRHPILVPPGRSGVLAELASGSLTAGATVARLADGTAIPLGQRWPVRRPRPYARKLAARRPLVTGQRIIDLLFPLALGGAAIIPGGFGTGKTVLEQAIARHAAVDVVVYCGCGERGNEMAELVADFAGLADPRTGGPLLDRTVLVANTSNMPVAAREASIYTAVTVAEYYRDLGLDVLLLADSISRWAEALREIGAALGQMPGEEGYPTAMAGRLAAFVERAGAVETLGGRPGSLSMILSVSPPGGDCTEPVTQALARACGASLILDTRLAHSRHFPAINPQASYSLFETEVRDFCQETVAADWSSLRQRCQARLRAEESLAEVAEIVGLDGLQDRDRLTMEAARLLRRRFLAQSAYGTETASSLAATAGLARRLLEAGDAALAASAAGRPLAEAAALLEIP
ncbi:MAG: V-type ATP synthase subunit A [Thermodesulfobacteriota bacterium]